MATAVQNAVPAAVKDAAYTYVGASAIAFEKISQANGELVERINNRFDNTRKDVEGQLATSRKDVQGQLKVAKRTAVANGKELRAKVDPIAERIEARLPMQVAKVLETGRTQAWDFYGVTAPKAPAAAPATKKAPAKKAAAKKTTARKTTARKTAAKK